MDNDQQSPDIAPISVSSFVEQVRSGSNRPEMLGLIGSSGPHLLAKLLEHSTSPLYILVADQKKAETLAADLAFFCGQPDKVHTFPNWEVRPYEALSPHPEVEATRLQTLDALRQKTARAVVVPIRALMQKVVSRNDLEALTERLRSDEDYNRDELLQRLVALGYHSVPLVEDRGTFSVRGDILDIYPPTSPEPVRVEFFGDTIDRMRPFDAATQRSRAQRLKDLLLLPAREMVLAGAYLERFSAHLKQRCDELGLARPQREAVLEEVREGILSPGRCFLLPLNYGGLESFFDYAEGGTWVVVDSPSVEQAADLFADEVTSGESLVSGKQEPYVPAGDLFLRPEQIEKALSRVRRVDFSSLRLYHLENDRPAFRLGVQGNQDLHADRGAEEQGLSSFVSRLKEWRQDDWRTLLVCHTQGQAERLRDLLDPHGVRLRFLTEASLSQLQSGQICISLGNLSAGFRLPGEKLAVVTEEEIFGQRVRRRDAAHLRSQAVLSSLAELKGGDYVVHADHGIGRYHGLFHMKTAGMEGDFLHLEYAGGDKLYLPVDRIEKVQKYQGGEGHQPRLDRMGGSAWEKATLRARAAVEELARELLNIYARRQMTEGFRFSPPDRLFKQFEASFPYEETQDQLSAIGDVLADMQSGQPMDRLICGDVGYGKTEVAMRAAFKAVLDGKQVAVLVPTTVLARQHWESFSERFADYAVEVEMVSRFRSAAEQKQVLELAARGKVDILVGTHRLLQRDVRFKDLGLIIIDEEQRFGVTHKEKLKKMRAEVGILTLTATPIPRTLHMGMMGLRSMSVIETPPVDRLAVRTYVTRFDDDLIREAILRELRRGGQVFFVHNRVQSIEAQAEFIRTLVPEAKVAVGHGQMGEKALEKVMMSFISGETNVLVSSTIIENGLDIPRANTILVNRADCFGLSQLYQLRGRVGRSKHRAYAYLLIPGEGTLTREARERLRVLQEQTELGAGFRIASHDLELRGAGDLLGPKQAGQIAAIGFEMYSEMLQETIAELQGQTKEERIDPEIRLGLSAFLPEKYLPDPNQRLVFYKKMASADSDETLYELADELRDRYGEIPEPAALLIEVMKLRVIMKRLRIEMAEYDGRQLVFSVHGTTPIPPEKILRLLEYPGGRYRFSPDYRLSIKAPKLKGRDVVNEAKKELQAFL